MATEGTEFIERCVCSVDQPPFAKVEQQRSLISFVPLCALGVLCGQRFPFPSIKPQRAQSSPRDAFDSVNQPLCAEVEQQRTFRSFVTHCVLGMRCGQSVP